MIELEFKYAVLDADGLNELWQQGVRALLPLDLAAVYLCHPKLTHQKEISLRVRRENDRFLTTLKYAAPHLFDVARYEWVLSEAPLDPENCGEDGLPINWFEQWKLQFPQWMHHHLSLTHDTDAEHEALRTVADLLPLEYSDAWTILGRTQITRTGIEWSNQGHLWQVTRDQGWLYSGTHTEAIDELEAERVLNSDAVSDTSPPSDPLRIWVERGILVRTTQTKHARIMDLATRHDR